MRYTLPLTHPTATSPLGSRAGEENTGLGQVYTHLTVDVLYMEQRCEYCP